MTDLGEVSVELLARLQPTLEDLPMDERSSQLLEHFLARLVDSERSQLHDASNKRSKRWTLCYLVTSSPAHQTEHTPMTSIQRMLNARHSNRQPDWDEVATRWLELIQPVWYERLKSRRSKPLLLRDIRKELFTREAELGPACIERFRSFPVIPPPEERIRACIVGVGEEVSSLAGDSRSVSICYGNGHWRTKD